MPRRKPKKPRRPAGDRPPCKDHPRGLLACLLCDWRAKGVRIIRPAVTYGWRSK